jgi:uncharacterized membrane protein YbhN (UPF0104 family)
LNKQVKSARGSEFFLIFLLKVFIGCGIIFLLLIKIELAEVFHALQNANYGYLFLGMMCFICIRILFAWQNATAVRHFDIGLSTSRAFVINQIVGFYLLFLPASFAGGVLKWHRISKHSGKGVEVLATIIGIKIYNLTFILAAGGLALIVENPFGPKLMPLMFLALLLALVVFLLIFQPKSLPAITSVCEYGLRRLPDWLSRRLCKLGYALNYLRRLAPLQLFYFLVVPPLVLCLVALVYYVTALGLGFEIPLFAAIWIGAMVVLIQNIPISISGLGLREGALVMLLPLYGISQPQALALSLISFGYVLVMGLLGGLLEINEQFLKSGSLSSRRRIG